jgi:cyclophilin family peptidyl-prolyl cis-trans isomerase
MRLLALTLVGSLAVLGGLDAQGRPGADDPRLVVDTAKGTIEIRLFPTDAPKSVDHILGLVKRGFYRGLRIHRVTSALAQFGDPLTRDMSRKGYWGSGGSGNPIGVAELSKRLTHRRGTVALAHGGAPTIADSQLYIMKTASPSLDGKHAIIGQVTSGMDVVDRLAVADLIKQISVK